MHKVFLGVGHGGRDPGAMSDGYLEKDMTLVMALACRDELQRHGAEVRMSRTEDVDNPLSEVIRQCNAYTPDLAVDIHVNAGGGDGFEAFHALGGGRGKVLAENIEAEVKKLGQNSRGIKTRANAAGRDYYGFIRQTVCPAIIAEAGFIDSPDRAVFDTAEKQQAFGRVYAHGILQTLGVAVLPEGDADDLALQGLVASVQARYGFEDQTMEYLRAYRYARALLERLDTK